jgi:hypothetical protein
MKPTTQWIFVLMVLIAAGGCTTMQPSQSPPALSTVAREQIGHMAVRGPTVPKISLTTDLDGKGAAAGKTAVAAGAGWLGGTFDAAGQSGDEGGALVLALGLVATPFVAAGGAMYGAAAADSADSVAGGNAVLDEALDFAPAQLQRALERRLDEAAPVSWEFVPAGATDGELAQQGFDSVLDLEMTSIASQPSENHLHVYFTTMNRARLTALPSGRTLATRSYDRSLPPRAVSSWAGQHGEALTSALGEVYAEVAAELAEEFFLAPAIRVKGLEPVSRNAYSVGRIPGLRPLFVWSALDGGSASPAPDVEYELAISVRGDDEPQLYRTSITRYVTPENLQACKTYEWQVRAHYTSFGSAVASPWTPEYRFKTPCPNPEGR